MQPLKKDKDVQQENWPLNFPAEQKESTSSDSLISLSKKVSEVSSPIAGEELGESKITSISKEKLKYPSETSGWSFGSFFRKILNIFRTPPPPKKAEDIELDNFSEIEPKLKIEETQEKMNLGKSTEIIEESLIIPIQKGVKEPEEENKKSKEFDEQTDEKLKLDKKFLSNAAQKLHHYFITNYGSGKEIFWTIQVTYGWKIPCMKHQPMRKILWNHSIKIK